MSIPTCEHLKPGGARCGSPAERGRQYCFFHNKTRKLVPKVNLFVLDRGYRRPDDPYNEFEFPLLEDAAAVQIGFMQLIHGVAQDRFNSWKAKAILSALHGAAANLRQLDNAIADAEKYQEADEASEKKPAANVDEAHAAQEFVLR
jgi:hypothetical protein